MIQGNGAPFANYIDYYGFGEDIYMSETGAFTGHRVYPAGQKQKFC